MSAQNMKQSITVSPLELGKGDERLQRLLANLDRQLRDLNSDLFGKIEGGLLDPLRAKLKTLAALHQQFLDNAALESPSKASILSNGRNLHDRINTYRYAVRTQIFDSLRDYLDDQDFGYALSRFLNQLAEDQAPLLDVAPDVIACNEPEALYQRQLSDTSFQRFRKFIVRLRRKRKALLRSIGNGLRSLFKKPIIPDPLRIQQVPFRQLARYRFFVNFPRLQASLYEDLQQRFARPLDELERQLTSWTHHFLTIEQEFGNPAYFLPDANTNTGQERSTEDNAASNDAVQRNEKDERMAYEARAQGQALDNLLVKLGGLDDFKAVQSQAEQIVSDTMFHLRLDIARSDSFMLNLSQHEIPSGPLPVTKSQQRRFTLWTTWHRHIVARLSLLVYLMRFEEDTQDQQRALICQLIDSGIKPIIGLLQRGVGELNTLREETNRACSVVETEDDMAVLSGTIQDVLQRADEHLTHELLARFKSSPLDSEIQETTDNGINRLLEYIQDLPDSFVMHLLLKSDAGTIDPDLDTREVRFREIIQQTLDALLVERLRTAATPLIQTLDHVLGETEQVPSIIRFNLEGALEELERATSDKPVESTVAAAQEFVLNGFDRSTETLTRLIHALELSPLASAEILFQTLMEAWDRLHGRIRLEGRIQEQLLDFHSRVSVTIRQFADATQAHIRKRGAYINRLFRFGRIKAKVLIRMGQSAVGTAGVSEEEHQITHDVIGCLEAFMSRFPLVYRRLFSFQPVTDPTLLEGRSVDLNYVAEHYERWKQGLVGGLVITGSYGDGITSFLNVLRAQTLPEAKILSVDFNQRLYQESDIARRLASAFLLPEHTYPEAFSSLSRLSLALRQHLSAKNQVVFFIEHLEHLFMRTFGGTRLIEALFMLVSRTDSYIFWVFTTSELAWQFIEKTAPSATSLVMQRTLSPIGRKAIQSLIINRHRRSGLPLIYDEPKDINPLLRRQLRKLPAEQDRQALLQDEYFDRLYRLCGQNVTYALFYWLRSVRLIKLEAAVHVVPADPLSFTFLNNLLLGHAFTLKAFLQHATLTVEEHTQILQVSIEESFQAFETLYNYLLIEPFPQDHSSTDGLHPSIESGYAYRIRPLVIYPVVLYLREKNIVY